MNLAQVDDALDSLTRHDLERMQERIAKRLQTCLVCGGDGAEALRLVPARHFGSGGTTASLMVCRPCFEKHRLPEGRAAVTA